MRKLNQFMMLLMTVSLVALSSCSSDDDNNGGGTTGGGGTGDEFLTAKIDGADFAAAQTPAVIVGAQSTNGVLAVQGGDNSGNTINMAIQNYAGVGTYTTGNNLTNGNLIQYLEINPVGGWASNLASAAVGGLMVGTIEITSDDGSVVEGTFSFEGYNANNMTTKMVTDGTFKAKFD